MSKSIKLFHWLPRLICILAILFISMFALDSFEGNNSIGEKIGAFAIHLIPTYILTVFLLLAWKWERIGGIIFIVVGLGFIPFIATHNYAMNQSIWHTLLVVIAINVPFIIVGMLFLVSHYLKKKNN